MSTDSSDDENLDLIREATNNPFINDSMFKHSGDTERGSVQVEEKKLPPSLRRIQDENEQFRLFNITPQFQNYVAKALIKKLDEYLRKRLFDYPIGKKKKRKTPDGIKLLKSSKCLIDYKENDKFCDSDIYKHNSNYKNIQFMKSEKDLNVSELKAIAVSGEDILNLKDIKYWSNRSKAQVFRYAKDKKGVLNIIKPEFKRI